MPRGSIYTDGIPVLVEFILVITRAQVVWGLESANICLGNVEAQEADILPYGQDDDNGADVGG